MSRPSRGGSPEVSPGRIRFVAIAVALVLAAGLVAALAIHRIPPPGALVRRGQALEVRRGGWILAWGRGLPVESLTAGENGSLRFRKKIPVATPEGAAYPVDVEIDFRPGAISCEGGAEKESPEFHRSGSSSAGGCLTSLLAGFLAEALRSPDAAPAGDGPRLRQALGERIRSAGWPVERFSLAVSASDVSRSIEIAGIRRRLPPQSPSRVIVVGWDGADWSLLDELAAKGKLPVLAKLLPRGARGILATYRPTVSPMIWTSIATGVEPEEHGILDFLRPSPSGPVPIRSTDRRAPALWNIASATGRSVDVVGWWATYPAEEISGTLVSERLAYQLGGIENERAEEAALVSPASAAKWIGEIRERPDRLASSDLARFIRMPVAEIDRRRRDSRDRVSRLADLVASTRTFGRVASRLAARTPTANLQMFYFEGADTIGHLFAAERPPRLDWVEARDVEIYGGAVDELYQELDRILGKILESFDSRRDTLLLVSDHGFRWGNDRPRVSPSTEGATAGAWHGPGATFFAVGRGVHAGARGGGHVRDLAPTILAILGLPAPRSSKGAPLRWAFDSSAIGEVGSADWGAAIAPVGPVAGAGSPGVDPEIVARLRALGYIGAAGKTERQETSGVSALSSPVAAPVDETFAAHMNRGTLALERGDHDLARREFESTVKIEPRAAAAWNKLAIAEIEGADFGAAESSFHHVLEIAPGGASDRETAVIGLVTLWERGSGGASRSPEARALLDAEIASSPKAAALLAKRGALAVQSGEWERARADLQSAVRLDPKDVVSRNLLAADFARLGKMSEARRLLDESLRIRSDQPEVRELRNRLGR